MPRMRRPISSPRRGNRFSRADRREDALFVCPNVVEAELIGDIVFAQRETGRDENKGWLDSWIFLPLVEDQQCAPIFSLLEFQERLQLDILVFSGVDLCNNPAVIGQPAYIFIE